MGLRISPAQVGVRVSVRYALAAPDPASGARLTDVVGVLERWSDGSLDVRRADGSAVTVAEDALVAGRPVPPPPPARR